VTAFFNFGGRPSDDEQKLDSLPDKHAAPGRGVPSHDRLSIRFDRPTEATQSISPIDHNHLSSRCAAAGHGREWGAGMEEAPVRGGFSVEPGRRALVTYYAT